MESDLPMEPAVEILSSENEIWNHEELTHGARDRIMVLHSMWMGSDL